MSLARERLEDLHWRSRERRYLLDRAGQHLAEGDVLDAVDKLVAVVGMLSHAEESVMQLHAECFAMIEQSSRVLQLDAALRPVVIQIDQYAAAAAAGLP